MFNNIYCIRNMDLKIGLLKVRGYAILLSIVLLLLFFAWFVFVCCLVGLF